MLKQILSKIFIRARNAKNVLTNSTYRFVSFRDLVEMTDAWLLDRVWDYDLIIGVPRSGLLVANLLSLRLSIPLTTPETVGDISWLSKRIPQVANSKFGRVVIVDDSLSSGDTMEEVFELVKSKLPNTQIDKAVLIIKPGEESRADFYHKVIPQPRIFEWNVLHSKKATTIGFDLDGVLCEDIPYGLESDNLRYIEWISNVKRYLVPSYEIDFIISNRLEKYRPQTEEWLKKQGVKYKELFLCPADSKEERKALNPAHKTRVLLDTKPNLFLESSREESIQLSKDTGIPILCISEKVLY